MGRKKLFHQNIIEKDRVPFSKFKKLRKENNWSLDTLARMTELTSRYLWDLETGRIAVESVKAENRERICNAIGVSIEELFVSKEGNK